MKLKELKLKDLDELIEYYESYPKDIHLHTFKFLRYTWNKTKIVSDVDLYRVLFEDDEVYESLRLTIYSNEWVKALELALNIKNWFKHIGYQYLDDNNLVCVDVLAMGDRTTLIVDEYEGRYGLDVVIRFSDRIKRRYETIEEFNVNTEIE